MSAELRVLCEGATEQNFVTQVLAPSRVFARPEPLLRGTGGVVSFERLRNAIKADLGRSRPHQFVTTMIDLYGLPDFPEAHRVEGESVMERVRRIETAMSSELPSQQFIPYIQVHEFEALLFVSLDLLPSAFPDGEADDAPRLLAASAAGRTPEEIDEGLQTAPSKRVTAVVPAYGRLKSVAGPAIVRRIGIQRLKAACPHFSAWVTRLEQLAEHHHSHSTPSPSPIV